MDALDTHLGDAEPFANELAREWAAAICDSFYRPEDTPAIAAVAAQHADPRVAWLSQAFDILFRQAWQLRPSAVHWEQVQAEVRAVQQHGWPRASRLAELAWALCLAGIPGRSVEALALMKDEVERGAEGRPAIERAWTYAYMCQVYKDLGHFEDALTVGFEAERLADESQCRPLRILATFSVMTAYLAFGDCDSALEAIAKISPDWMHCRVPQTSIAYSLILALLLQQQYDAALQVIENNPWLVDAWRLDGNPRVGALVACVLAEAGETGRAQVLLDSLRPLRLKDLRHQREPRAWLTARTLLTLNRPQEARLWVEGFLAEPSTQVDGLSPLSGAQLYESLSRACEATGDLRAAMAALQVSQSHCARWVGQSTRSRLHALRLAAAEGAPSAEVVKQRVQALDRWVEHATEETNRALTRAMAETPPRDSTALPTDKRYVAQVLHELRNPMGGVVSLTSLLLMSQLDERQRKWAELIQTSGNLLMDLCNDLLDIAKLEARKFELRLVDTNADQLVKEVVALLEPLAQSKGLGVHVNLDGGAPVLKLDRKRVMQVMLNLLDNAIKYTASGDIRVRMGWMPSNPSGRAGALRVEVHDTGPGFDDAEKAKLFQEFVQLPGPGGDTGQGTGLGLALSRALVQRMGGVLGVDSTPGQGSCFWFTLYPDAGQAQEQPEEFAGVS